MNYYARPTNQNQIFDGLSCQYQTVDRFAAEILTSTVKSVTVVHVNIVSLHKNYDTLKIFLSEFSKPVEVICLSETRLNDRNLKHCIILSYNMYCCNSATRTGDAAIFIREALQCQQLSAIKIKVDGCEDVWVELKINNNESLVVGSVYRHPSTNIKGFEDAFVHVIKTFKTNQNYVVLGDFNINYNETHCHLMCLIIP